MSVQPLVYSMHPFAKSVLDATFSRPLQCLLAVTLRGRCMRRHAILPQLLDGGGTAQRSSGCRHGRRRAERRTGAWPARGDAPRAAPLVGRRAIGQRPTITRSSKRQVSRISRRAASLSAPV